MIPPSPAGGVHTARPPTQQPSSPAGTARARRSTLDICVFSITSDEISRVIMARHSDGVKVRVITDNDTLKEPGSDIATMKKIGCVLRTLILPDPPSLSTVYVLGVVLTCRIAACLSRSTAPRSTCTTRCAAAPCALRAATALAFTRSRV